MNGWYFCRGIYKTGLVYRAKSGQVRRINNPVWAGKELYGTVGGELVRAALPR